MKAIVITFDRLALRMLGCSGNEWVATPHFDRLAAGSAMFEQHFAENLDSAAESHAWWTGCYQFPTSPARRAGATGIIDALRQAGIGTHLLLEAGARVPEDVRTAFATVDEVDGYDGLDADDGDTPFARLVETAIEQFEELGRAPGDSWLLWLKSHGVPRPWLAPREWATRFLDLVDESDSGAAGEEFAEQEADVVPSAGPERVVDLSPEEFDTLLTAVASFGESPGTAAEATEIEWRLSRQVYAGYVALLDDWLGQLLEEVDRQLAGDDVLVIVTAAEGESLGERAGMPARQAALGEEHVHTCLFVRTGHPDLNGRRFELTQPVDVGPTLLDWFGTEPAAVAIEGHSLLSLLRTGEGEREAAWLGTGARGRAIRTRDRFLQEGQAGGGEPQLFVKPDDLWEVHNVAGQSPDGVEVLSTALVEFVRRTRAGVPAQPPPVLLETVDETQPAELEQATPGQ